MTRFRPCIDLHAGQVKQIVGGSLSDDDASLQTNYVSTRSPSYYASLYHHNGLIGGHVIMLGPDNDKAAEDALIAWPNGLQVGGGITDQNAAHWISLGAEKVIITSFLFPDASFNQNRLDSCIRALGGDKGKLVIDLSCRKCRETWFVATNRWQTVTAYEVSAPNIIHLEAYCSEFLIHAADNEGLQQGIDEELVQRLAQICSVPVTYAGGANSLSDLEKVRRISNGKVDVTIGSALDIFGGQTVRFEDCVDWNRAQPS